MLLLMLYVLRKKVLSVVISRKVSGIKITSIFVVLRTLLQFSVRNPSCEWLSLKYTKVE